MKFSISILSLLFFSIHLFSQEGAPERPKTPIVKCTDARFLRVKDCADMVSFDQDQNIVFHQKSGKPFTGFCKSCFFNENLEMYLQFIGVRLKDRTPYITKRGILI